MIEATLSVTSRLSACAEIIIAICPGDGGYAMNVSPSMLNSIGSASSNALGAAVRAAVLNSLTVDLLYGLWLPHHRSAGVTMVALTKVRCLRVIAARNASRKM